MRSLYNPENGKEPTGSSICHLTNMCSIVVYPAPATIPRMIAPHGSSTLQPAHIATIPQRVASTRMRNDQYWRTLNFVRWTTEWYKWVNESLTKFFYLLYDVWSCIDEPVLVLSIWQTLKLNRPWNHLYIVILLSWPISTNISWF